jgi:hypothetical protein
MVGRIVERLVERIVERMVGRCMRMQVFDDVVGLLISLLELDVILSNCLEC